MLVNQWAPNSVRNPVSKTKVEYVWERHRRLTSVLYTCVHMYRTWICADTYRIRGRGEGGRKLALFILNGQVDLLKTGRDRPSGLSCFTTWFVLPLAKFFLGFKESKKEREREKNVILVNNPNMASKPSLGSLQTCLILPSITLLKMWEINKTAFPQHSWPPQGSSEILVYP